MRHYRTAWVSLLLLFLIACSSITNSNNSGDLAKMVQYANTDITDEKEKPSSVKNLDKSESVTGNTEKEKKRKKICLCL